ncbi:MAG: ATP-binding protein [Solirubrobacterales bacterium]
MPVCPACGQRNPPRARFCMACAAPLAADEPGPHGARKTVTIVFCDVADSTVLGDRLDPESVREVMTRFFRAMRDALEHHGGTVEKYIGDAVMAVFGIPLLREDDALRAVRAAVQMQDALGGVNDEIEARFGIRLRARIGVNTGEVVVGDVAAGHALVVGDAVNVAARLEQAAGAGEVLLGPDTHVLVRDHVAAEPVGPLELKGKPEPITAYRVLDLLTGPDVGARPEPPLVGRRDELATVLAAYERCIAERTPVTLTVLGPAGIGKSRLAAEVTQALGPTPSVLTARCLPYGDGITFWPVAEIVKRACGIADDDSRREVREKVEGAVAGAEDEALIVERIAALVGAGVSAGGVQETFWAVRRFLEWLAADRPLVVVWDDLQWAEPTFLDLIEHLAGWSRDVALFLLCLARPDVMDLRPTWGSGLPGSLSLSLAPLDDDDSLRLIEGSLGGSPIDEPATRRITESAGGNPLFLEEMLRMLEDDGYLRREAAGWVAARDLGDVAIPASIQALLGSRLDRLSAEELAVIRCASVIGKVFWWGAVAELAPAEIGPRVGTHLQSLVRRDLIRPERSTFAGEEAFQFHHLLIQEAAYRGTPKEQRAVLHERFADWVERAAAERAQEFEEVVGYHLEQAFRYGSELGAPASSQDPLGRRAGRPLAAAGMRALDRRDMSAAEDLLGRAAHTLGASPGDRLPVLLALGEARVETGDLVGAEEALTDAERLAGDLGDDRVVANAAILRLFLLESTDPKRLTEDAAVSAARWIARLEDLGDDRGLARAWRLMGDLHATRSRYAAADEAFERGIEHARRTGDAREVAESLGRSIGSGVYGPAPAAEIERRCAEVVAAVGGIGGHEAPALRALAFVRAMEGRFDEARELARRARSTLEDLGLRLRASWVSETAGAIEMLAGDPVAAERELRQGFDVAVELGEQGFRSTVAAALSHALIAQARLEEADRFARESELSAADDDIASQVLWRSARARILGASGAATNAEDLAREAIALVEQTDDVNMHADTLADLAEVLVSAGNRSGAAEALKRAIELYGAKGNTVAAARSRRRREEISAGGPT